jgi:HSP20 family protein
MSVMRFDPFGEPFRQLDRLTSQLTSGRRTPMGMPMDVWEAEDGYHVALDLPGVDADSIEIVSERNVLTIRAERSPEYDQAHNVLVAERPQGSFTRQLQVGDTLDLANVQANYSDGVLRLLIPVAEAAQPRRIPVERLGTGQSVGASAGGQTETAGAGAGGTGQTGADQ